MVIIDQADMLAISSTTKCILFKETPEHTDLY